MRMPTSKELTPCLVVAVIMVVGELLTHSTSDTALAIGHLLKAAAGLGILFALYRLAPCFRGE